MLLSIIMTTKGRGQQALNCLKRIRQTTDRKTELILVAYPDESNLLAFSLNEPELRLKTYWMQDRSIPCYNFGASVSTGSHIMGIDDDAWVADDWYEKVVKVISSVDNGHGYFKIQSDNRCYWAERAVASRRFLVDVIGGVLCIPHYLSQYDDVEKTDRAIEAGLFFETDAYIEHRHWSHGKAEIDDTYRDGGIKNVGRDQVMYEKRKKLGFPNDYEKSIISI